MEENKIGLFIRDRRLALGLTQQQLAEKLGVTDKAVSKWERSVSYPDITLLRGLAAALEVSVTELLAGEREQSASPVPPEVADAVVDTVAYAETARKKNGGWRWWLFVGLTAGCLTAAMVLLIVGAATRSMRGSLLVIKCVAFGWAVCYPLLRTERPVRNGMVIASVFVYPFLWSLGLHRAWHLGIVAVSVAYAWAVYWIFRRYRREPLKATFLILLLGVLLHFSINILVGQAYRAFVVTAFTLALDVLCLLSAWAVEKVRFYRNS